MLSIRDLHKTYEGTTRHEAIRGLSFDVDDRELVCVVGPSGAGKTTLLKCLSGLMAPSSGEVVLDGEPVTGPPPQMAYVFQDYGRSLMPWLTVEGNVLLPLHHKDLDAARREELVLTSLETVGLADARDRYPWQLSGGMQQRVAIARALAYEPDIMVMDEPFASLDAQTREDLEDMLLELHRTLPITMIFVTHDIDEAVYLADRVVVLSPAPTSVRMEVDVSLDEPRTQLRSRALPAFLDLRARVRESIDRGAPVAAGG